MCVFALINCDGQNPSLLSLQLICFHAIFIDLSIKIPEVSTFYQQRKKS